MKSNNNNQKKATQMVFIEWNNQKTRKRLIDFGMKTKQSFSLLILILVFICQNKEAFAQNNTDPKNAKFICTNDTGFILKEKGFAFLLANSLIDTTKEIEKWNKINQNDTIGRYYRINNSDNYLMCLPRSLDSFKQTFLIIMINAHGELVKREKYDFGNASEWNNYYRDFSKYGDFFLVHCSRRIWMWAISLH